MIEELVFAHFGLPESVVFNSKSVVCLFRREMALRKCEMPGASKRYSDDDRRAQTRCNVVQLGIHFDKT
jgi:hypothetical protein